MDENGIDEDVKRLIKQVQTKRSSGEVSDTVLLRLRLRNLRSMNEGAFVVALLAEGRWKIFYSTIDNLVRY